MNTKTHFTKRIIKHLYNNKNIYGTKIYFYNYGSKFEKADFQRLTKNWKNIIQINKDKINKGELLDINSIKNIEDLIPLESSIQVMNKDNTWIKIKSR